MLPKNDETKTNASPSQSLFSTVKNKALNAYTSAVVRHPFFVMFLTAVIFIIFPLGAFFQDWPPRLSESPEKGFDTVGTKYAGPRLTWSILQPSLLKGSRVSIDVSLLGATARSRTKRSWVDDLIQSFGSVACYDEPIPAMSYMAQFIVSLPSMEHLFSLNVLAQFCHLQEHLGPYLQPFEALTPYRQIWHVGQFLACLAPARHNNCSFVNPSDAAEVRRAFAQCLPHREAILNCRRHCQPHYQTPISNAAEIARHCPREPCSDVPAECQSQMWFDLFYRILPRDLTQRPILVNNFLPMYTYGAYVMQGFSDSVRLSDYVALAGALQNWSKLDGTKQAGLLLKGVSMDVKRQLLLEAAIDDSKFSLLAAFCVFLLIVVYSWSIAFALAVIVQLFGSMLSAMAVYRVFGSAEFPLLNLVVFVLLVSIGIDGAFLLLRVFPSPGAPAHFRHFRKALSHTSTTMFLTQFSTVVPFLLNLASDVIAFRTFGLFAALTMAANYVFLVLFLPSFLVIQHRHINPWMARWIPSRLGLGCCFPIDTSTVVTLNRTVSTKPSPKSPQETIQANSGSNAVVVGPNKTPTFGENVAVVQQPFPLPQNLEKIYANSVANANAFLDRRPSPLPPTTLERFCAFGGTLIDEVLPSVLIKGRFIWLGSLSTVFLFCLYVCLTQLSLPRYNPLQLFSSSNPHEFYDNNAERLFEFVGDKLAVPLVLRLMWGIRPVRSTDYLDAHSHSVVEADPDFRLGTASAIEALAEQMHRYRELPFVQHKAPFWPERFLEWSGSQSCPASSRKEQQKHKAAGLCCNIHNRRYSDVFLDFCIRLSTTQLKTSYNDTLLYHNTTFELVGYSAMLPTRLRYSHQFANLSASFDFFDKAFTRGGKSPAFSTAPEGEAKMLPMWYTTEWHLMSTWFDLQRSIINDFRQSFGVSFVVVLAFSAVVLRSNVFSALATVFAIDVCTVGVLVLLGWEIGVLEGVILVLVVGLSFDYTLHYGASIPDAGCAVYRVRHVVRKATVPNALAALSSVIAGATMLFAQTQAFVQVATFLVVCCSLSFLFATFFFVPLTAFYCGSNHSEAGSKLCKWCCEDDKASVP